MCWNLGCCRGDWHHLGSLHECHETLGTYFVRGHRSTSATLTALFNKCSWFCFYICTNQMMARAVCCVYSLPKSIIYRKKDCTVTIKHSRHRWHAWRHVWGHCYVFQWRQGAGAVIVSVLRMSPLLSQISGNNYMKQSTHSDESVNLQDANKHRIWLGNLKMGGATLDTSERFGNILYQRTTRLEIVGTPTRS